MSKLLANVTIALSLMLGASGLASAGSVHNQKCPAVKHKHSKAKAVAAKPQPARGVMLVEHRKQDVQILSFGP